MKSNDSADLAGLAQANGNAGQTPCDQDFHAGKVSLISLAHLSHDVFSSFLAPLLPLLIAKLSLTLSAVALLDIARKLPQLFNPLIGLVADRICVKYVVILAPAATALCMSLLGLAPTFGVLVLLLVISGFSAGAFHVPGPVLIKRYAGRRSGRGMSFYMFGGELARTLGPLLITAAIAWWGLEGTWRVLPVGLVASILMFVKLRDLKRIPGQACGPAALWHPGALRDKLPLFTGLTGYMLFRLGFKTAMTLYLPTYLVSRGESIWMAGIALSLLQFSGAIGTIGAGYIADRIGHRRLLLHIAILTPITGLGLLHAPAVLMLPLLLLTGILLFASSPVQLALVQDSRTSRPAFQNSLFMTLNTLVSGLAALFIGVLGDKVSLESAYTISAALTLLALPFVWLLPRPVAEQGGSGGTPA